MSAPTRVARCLLRVAARSTTTPARSHLTFVRRVSSVSARHVEQVGLSGNAWGVTSPQGSQSTLFSQCLNKKDTVFRIRTTSSAAMLFCHGFSLSIDDH
ncbi:hypothetical protein HK102_005285 [Quaeritorhiza haematococci]|nr:hypothetical protein HK102_005285 [Quaeritorhiza haematococci]